jgi:hypothetical protein
MQKQLVRRLFPSVARGEKSAENGFEKLEDRIEIKH